MGTSLLVISSMAAFAAFLAIFAALSTAMPMNEKCCKTKTVGGIMYIFMDQMVDPEAYRCINGCVYMPESGSSKKFCFAKGDLEVECNDSDMRPTGGMPGMSPTDGMPGMSTMDGGMKPTGGVTGCKCGKKKGERIIGGADADINEWPWMVSMTFSDGVRHKCGGTVVASEWIVTAAHCLYEDSELTVETKVEDVSIVLGEHDNFLEGEEILPRKVLKISKYIKHPDYEKITSNADIA